MVFDRVRHLNADRFYDTYAPASVKQSIGVTHVQISMYSIKRQDVSWWIYTILARQNWEIIIGINRSESSRWSEC
jgi:hypothetical protein